MFKTKIMNFPLLTDKLELENIKTPNVPKQMGLTWDELKKHGVVKEVIEKNDDGITSITKEFTSTDNTFTRITNFSMPTDLYEKYKAKISREEIIRDIISMEKEIDFCNRTCAVAAVRSLKDQKRFLMEEFGIKHEDIKTKEL
jgi:hypothetical protein